MTCRLGVAALVFALCIAGTDNASAAMRRRIALVSADTELLRSTLISLSAWGIDVVDAQASPPGRTLPEAQRHAAEIALQFQADAVSWISEGDGPSVLWIYDATTNDIASRVLGGRPPFDEPAAAAVALSLKALLRSSTVAPESERFGAMPVPAAVTASVLRLEGAVGGRMSPVEVAEARAALGIAVWPRALAERLGFGLAASVGPGVAIDNSVVSARFSDVAVSSSIGTRIRVAPLVGFEPGVGATMHFTSFHGTARNAGIPVSANRLDGSLDLVIALDVRLGSVALGVCATLGYLLWYQHYSVGDQAVLSTIPVVADAALRLSAGIL